MGAVLPTVINFCAGFGHGHALVSSYVDEKSTKLGKSFLLAVPSEMGQIIGLSSLALKIFETLHKDQLSFRTQMLCNVLPFAALPLLVFIEAIREGEYPRMSKAWNLLAPASLQLPETLQYEAKLDDDDLGYDLEEFYHLLSNPKNEIDQKPVLETFARLLSDHLTDVVKVASIVALLALVKLGEPLYGLSAFLAIGYDLAARNNLIPLDYRQIAETYFPAVSFFGNLLEGTLVDRLSTFAFESLDFAPGVAIALQNGLDYCFKKALQIKRPTFYETDAPLKQPEELTFETIIQVLDAEESAFVFSPPHLTTDVLSRYDLPRTKDFSKILPMFNAVPWQERINVIRPKLLSEKRFNDHVKEVKTKRRNISINANFMVNYIKEEMKSFMGVMQGGYRDGDQHDIPLAIKNLEIIAAYLYSLSPATQQVEIEDILLKLAVEGGGYCPEQLHKMTHELVVHVTLQTKISDDPIEQYELSLLQKCESLRKKIVRTRYDKMIWQPPKTALHAHQAPIYIQWLPDSIKRNMHVERLFQGLLSLGFAPIPLHERSELSLAEFLFSESILAYYIKDQFLDEYREHINEPFEDSGLYAEHFGSYIEGILNKNKQLTSGQKDTILGKWREATAKMNVHYDTFIKIKRSFYHLALYRLGLLKFANAGA